MKPIYLMLLIWLPIILLFYSTERQKTAVAAHHIRKKREEIAAMEMLAKRFVGKECIIYTITSNDGSVRGVIREAGAGGMLIEDAQGQLQAVNLEYVTRIREFPRNRKGKKKSVILD